MTTKSELPRYNLPKALSLRDELVESLTGFADRVVDGQALNELVEHSLQFLPKRTPTYGLHDFFRSYAGRRITGAELKEVAWKIAGNTSSFAAGKSLPHVTTSSLAALGWTPVELTRLWPFRRSKYMLCDVRLVALAGAAAGMEIDTVWSQKFVPVVALHVGFTPRYKKRPLQDITELVGLWFYTKFKLNTTGDGVTIDGIECPSVCQQHNREIIDIRRRIQPCPNRFNHPCSRCAVGRDRCIAGTHRISYRQDTCAICKQRSVIDDECNPTICINCFHGQRAAAHT
jgi:hypothetical protein